KQRVARDIHESDIGQCGNGNKPNGKTVYPVSEIYGIRRTDNDKNGKRYIEETKIKKPLLEKWDAEHRVVRVVGVYIKEDTDGKGNRDLRPEFIPCTQSSGILFYRLEIII